MAKSPLLADITLKEDQLVVSGQLDFWTVMPIFEKSIQLIPNCQSLIFDLSQVTSSNSAAVALLVEWIKYAKSVRKKITFEKIPDNLFPILKNAELENLIK